VPDVRTLVREGDAAAGPLPTELRAAARARGSRVRRALALGVDNAERRRRSATCREAASCVRPTATLRVHREALAEALAAALYAELQAQHAP
jgi:hypothetical protein